MSYIIASEKLGVVDEPFIPKDGINLEALLAGGFIVRAKVSTTEEEKPAKPKYKKAPKE
jgi:hypothetical protein